MALIRHCLISLAAFFTGGAALSPEAKGQCTFGAGSGSEAKHIDSQDTGRARGLALIQNLLQWSFRDWLQCDRNVLSDESIDAIRIVSSALRVPLKSSITPPAVGATFFERLPAPLPDRIFDEYVGAEAGIKEEMTSSLQSVLAFRMLDRLSAHRDLTFNKKGWIGAWEAAASSADLCLLDEVLRRAKAKGVTPNVEGWAVMLVRSYATGQRDLITYTQDGLAQTEGWLNASGLKDAFVNACFSGEVELANEVWTFAWNSSTGIKTKDLWSHALQAAAQSGNSQMWTYVWEHPYAREINTLELLGKGWAAVKESVARGGNLRLMETVWKHWKELPQEKRFYRTFVSWFNELKAAAQSGNVHAYDLVAEVAEDRERNSEYVPVGEPHEFEFGEQKLSEQGWRNTLLAAMASGADRMVEHVLARWARTVSSAKGDWPPFDLDWWAAAFIQVCGSGDPKLIKRVWDARKDPSWGLNCTGKRKCFQAAVAFGAPSELVLHPDDAVVDAPVMRIDNVNSRTHRLIQDIDNITGAATTWIVPIEPVRCYLIQ